MFASDNAVNLIVLALTFALIAVCSGIAPHLRALIGG